MKRVLVDMDGVLADVYTQMRDYEYKETGFVPSEESLLGKLEGESFPSFEKIVRSKGFFRSAPLIPHSIEGLHYLNSKYQVTIVSSATEFKNSLIEKYDWLNEHFPFIKWQQMIFCGSKNNVQGDIMIDDHLKNLHFFAGERILFTQPHNALVIDPTLYRVNNWHEIMCKL